MSNEDETERGLKPLIDLVKMAKALLPGFPLSRHAKLHPSRGHVKTFDYKS